MVTEKKLAKRHRDMKIKATYESLPPGVYELKELAEMYHVSVSTVFYAIHGRPPKNGGVKNNNHE